MKTVGTDYYEVSLERISVVLCREEDNDPLPFFILNSQVLSVWRLKVLFPRQAGLVQGKGRDFLYFRLPSNFIGVKVFELLFVQNIVYRAHIALHVENIWFCIICWSYYPYLFFKLMYKFVDDIFRVGEVPEGP